MTDTTDIQVTGLETTVDQYVDTWNELDNDQRRTLCERVWATDGHYVDPLLDAEGPGAIAEGLGALQAQFPGHRVARTTAVDAHHDRARFGWNIIGPDGAVVVAGIDVAVLTADGRLQSITGFFGDPEAVTA